MWDLPGPEMEPVFPASAGRFLNFGQPGKSKHCIFWVWDDHLLPLVQLLRVWNTSEKIQQNAEVYTEWKPLRFWNDFKFIMPEIFHIDNYTSDWINQWIAYKKSYFVNYYYFFMSTYMLFFVRREAWYKTAMNHYHKFYYKSSKNAFN